MTDPTPPAIGVEDDAHQLLVETIAADATISSSVSGVFIDEPRLDQPTPYLIVSLLSAEDVHTFTDRAFTSLLVEVRAVVDHRDANTPRLVVELAESVRALLDAGVESESVRVRGLRRNSRIAQTDLLEGGIRRYHRGGVYTLIAQSIA